MYGARSSDITAVPFSNVMGSNAAKTSLLEKQGAWARAVFSKTRPAAAHSPPKWQSPEDRLFRRTHIVKPRLALRLVLSRLESAINNGYPST
jgi:hypothetical protein